MPEILDTPVVLADFSPLAAAELGHRLIALAAGGEEGTLTVQQVLALVVGAAPGALDTLNELAAALGDDPNYAATTAALIAARLPLAGGVMTGAIQDATFAQSAAPTKKLGLLLSAIAAGQTRNIIMPDRDVDLSKLGIFSMGAVVPSGNTIQFASIPSGVRRISIPFEDISTNGTGIPTLQVGDSGGYVVAGYKGTASNVASSGVNSSLNSTGFRLSSTALTAASTLHGIFELLRIGASNRWSVKAIPSASDAALSVPMGGSIALSGALDRVRITTSDTFDAQGSVDCQYEF